jgi:hypothetical protein
MPNVPAKTENENAAYLARYGTTDPYLAYSEEGGPGIIGQRLGFAKGDWSLGADKTPVPHGARFLMLVPTASRGWVKWSEVGIFAADVGLIKDGFLMKHRYALGDMDESQWRVDPAGNPLDPWSQYVSVQLVELSPPHGDVTFTSQSWGGSLALKDMCRVYAIDAAQHPDAFPVVSLAVRSRPHKAYGQIKGPWFLVQGWASVDDVKAGRKALRAEPIGPGPAKQSEAAPRAKAKAKPKPTSVTTEIDDAIPW